MKLRYKRCPHLGVFEHASIYADFHRVFLPPQRMESWHRCPGVADRESMMEAIRQWIAEQSARNIRLQPYSSHRRAWPWCCYCGRRLTHPSERSGPESARSLPTDASREHLDPLSIVPRSQQNPENLLRDCCRECNTRRGSLPLLRFLIDNPLCRRAMPRAGAEPTT